MTDPGRLPSLRTELFGELIYNPSVNWYEGETTWNGASVRINFELDENDSIETGLQTAAAMWPDMEAWNSRIRDFAAAELLELKNESWLEEDEAEVTADEFKSRMELESIGFKPEGWFEFWHNDGDLFWGHFIFVGGNLADGPLNAEIPG